MHSKSELIVELGQDKKRNLMNCLASYELLGRAVQVCTLYVYFYQHRIQDQPTLMSPLIVGDMA